MHMHLQKLAKRHIEAKFVKIDAEKTMFFTSKVRVYVFMYVCDVWVCVWCMCCVCIVPVRG
jgi:hypothetical protein